jgi:predicted nucleotidyltransferase
MKILGIITEYNPFHNVHLYHLSKARETTNQDANGFSCGELLALILLIK